MPKMTNANLLNMIAPTKNSTITIELKRIFNQLFFNHFFLKSSFLEQFISYIPSSLLQYVFLGRKSQLLCSFNYSIYICSLFVCSRNLTNLCNSGFVAVLLTYGCKTSSTAVCDIMLLNAVIFFHRLPRSGIL